MKKIEIKVVNTIRCLALDAIAEAKSGHPGIALGAAPILFATYAHLMNYDPNNEKAENRDRFVLSAGHGSSLLYATLSLLTNKVSVEGLKTFRKLDSKFTGHPEVSMPFVEASTGPLGQGVAMAVGMAIAEKKAREGKSGGNYTFCLAGDGCLMEGVAIEALDIAATLNLNKFILLFDSNDITIEGNATLAQGQDLSKIFKAKGFNIQIVKNGNDVDKIVCAIEKAKKSTKPSVVIVRTHIGFGSKKVDTSDVHGKPFNKEEVKEIKRNFNLSEQEFFVAPDVLEYCEFLKSEHMSKINESCIAANKKNETIDENNLSKTKEKIEVKLNIEDFKGKDISSRDAGGMALNMIANIDKTMFGGSADVAPSTRQYIINGGYIDKNDFSKRNIHFGVREHAMAAIGNGIALYGKNRFFASTFFSFFDYLKPALRLSAQMKLQNMYIFTSDSIGAGEDGPTHQPVEQLVTLRAIPDICDFRPCDAVETAYCYQIAYDIDVPTAIILSRQKLKNLNISTLANVQKGAYVAYKAKSEVKGIILSSGSEVDISIQAAKSMDEKGFGCNVVNFVSTYLFDKLTDKEKEKVLPSKIVNRVIVEAASVMGLSKYASALCKSVTVDTFGKSASGEKLFEYFGFTVENIAKQFDIKIK